MPEQYHLRLIEPGEKIVFDRRHSLWEIWKNFVIGAGSIVALVLLLTKFKPGPSASTNWGYIILISVLALFFVLWYGAWPLFKRRKQAEKRMFIPLATMVLAAGAWGALMWFRNSEGFSRIWSTIAWIAFAVVIVGWLIYPIFAWFFAHFVLTDRRVILSQGILNKSTMAIPLEQITNIRSDQNVWERVFRYGDVEMESAGEYGQQTFTNISRPLEVKKMIFEERDRWKESQETLRGHEMAEELAAAIQAGAAPAAAAPAPATAAATGVVERLEKLAELHRSGALSDEEFQRAKQELLEMDETEGGQAT